MIVNTLAPPLRPNQIQTTKFIYQSRTRIISLRSRVKVSEVSEVSEEINKRLAFLALVGILQHMF